MDWKQSRNIWVKQLRKEDGDLTDENGALVSRDINIGGKATVWMGKGESLGWCSTLLRRLFEVLPGLARLYYKRRPCTVVVCRNK
ncbi:hypothetical protein C8R44DRAFT_819223 [Mycena epipterygia]|nr:hypothetical protein C8R44DRAFT_819223 [Mycena epipterygia]